MLSRPSVAQGIANVDTTRRTLIPIRIDHHGENNPADIVLCSSSAAIFQPYSSMPAYFGKTDLDNRL